jgi:hypothetical protein
MGRPDEICAITLWGTHRGFPRRGHLVPLDRDTALCGLPVHDLYEERPHVPWICAECALAFVAILFRPVPTPLPPRHGRTA